MKPPIVSISRQRAIWQNCHQCVAADKASHWIQVVEVCQGYSCPLYHVRPVRNEKGVAVEAHRIPLFVDGFSPEIAKMVGFTLPHTTKGAEATETHEIEKTPWTKGVAE